MLAVAGFLHVASGCGRSGLGKDGSAAADVGSGVWTAADASEAPAPPVSTDLAIAPADAPPGSDLEFGDDGSSAADVANEVPTPADASEAPAPPVSTDLAVPPADTPPVQDLDFHDLRPGHDLPVDGLPPAFAELQGNTYEIVADVTPADAVIATLATWHAGAACTPGSFDAGAVYHLTFSASGRDLVLVETSASTDARWPLGYTSINFDSNSSDTLLHYWVIGGDLPLVELLIWQDDGCFVAQFNLPGVCFQSPMTPLSPSSDRG